MYNILILEHNETVPDKKLWACDHALQKMPDGKMKKIKDRWEYPTNTNKVTLYFPTATVTPKYSKEFFKDLANKGVKSIAVSEEDFYTLTREMNLNSCDGGSWLQRETFDIKVLSVFGVRVEIQK